MSAKTYEPPSREVVEADLRAFASAVRARYGERVKGIYLYGSRARGDEKDDSDADVAVIFDGPLDFWCEFRALSDLTYNYFLEHGVDIQAKPVALDAWNDPVRAPNPSIVRAIKRDGRPIESVR